MLLIEKEKVGHTRHHDDAASLEDFPADQPAKMMPDDGRPDDRFICTWEPK
jgi:hypothetical protein